MFSMELIKLIFTILYYIFRYYTVQYSEDKSGWQTIQENIDYSGNSYSARNLKPFTAYKFRLQATNDIGASGWSESSEDVRTLPAAPIEPPTDIKVRFCTWLWWIDGNHIIITFLCSFYYHNSSLVLMILLQSSAIPELGKKEKEMETNSNLSDRKTAHVKLLHWLPTILWQTH